MSLSYGHLFFFDNKTTDGAESKALAAAYGDIKRKLEFFVSQMICLWLLVCYKRICLRLAVGYDYFLISFFYHYVSNREGRQNWFTW